MAGFNFLIGLSLVGIVFTFLVLAIWHLYKDKFKSSIYPTHKRYEQAECNPLDLSLVRL